ncbi:MAG: TauD/TfdA family dioxygenase, partial [Verrucomicrobiota bacterium]|nr:TauD/TfdA family dioxygenase [Verrucomicrobiota bacterium]
MNQIQLIKAPSLWTGDELAVSENLYVNLEKSHMSEIKNLVSVDSSKDTDIHRIFDQVRDFLENGSGVVIIKKLPISDLSLEEAKRLFLNIVSMIVTPVSQSAKGELIFSVKDSGYADDDPRSRGPNTRKKLSFHSDRCDVIGFLCLQQAIKGGENQIASSVAIHNHMVENYPDLIETLYEPFYYKRHNVDTANDKPYCKQPIFSITEGKFACNLLRVLIDRAYSMPELPDMTDKQRNALDKIEEIASLPNMNYRYRQEPGDILLLNNWVTLHKRSEFIDHDEEK